MSRGGRQLLVLCLVLLVAIVLPFVVWGEHFEAGLTLQGARVWMEGFGAWAWAAGVALLVSDLVLPIPSTVVMSALGWMYGWFWGGLISVTGSVLSGCVAYGLSRYLGRSVAVWIAGEDGLSKAHTLFEKGGGWLVAVSRGLPVLPEAVACLAGLAKMPWRAFWMALVCGSLPLGFAFAAIGSVGHQSPGLAVALSVVVPAGMWWAARKWHAIQSSR
jgi:uncharacterized membrane protein YdjX (TVP38/TMEM64 family)